MAINCELTKLLAANSTTASFDASDLISTITRPSGAGVIDLSGSSSTIPSKLVFFAFGEDAENETFLFRVSGWKKVGSLYVAQPLASVTATLGSIQGVSGQAITDDDYVADTMAIATGYNADFADVNSPTGDIPASLMIDTLGHNLFQVHFAMGTATNGNLLWGKI